MSWIPKSASGFAPIVVLAGGAVIGWVVFWILFFVLKYVARTHFEALGHALLRRCRAPFQWIFPLAGLWLAMGTLPLSSRVTHPSYHAIEILLIVLAAWLAVRLINVFGDLLSVHYRVDVADNLQARKIQTQFKVLRRVGRVLIVTLASGLVLVTFPGIRALGAALFATAGAAGIVLGLAARPVLSNLLAGIQIAMTEPIRLEDSVVVEGEWGWIEEITTTYVVVRIWDLRRLILPLSYFIENPFQNWTRKTADLLGTAYIYADYTVPVQAVRDELHRILQASELWDGKAWSLVVTNLTEHAVEIRAMVSAANSGNTFNLRCLVREKLITFLQQNYPDCLPRARLSLNSSVNEHESGHTQESQRGHAEKTADSESSNTDDRA